MLTHKLLKAKDVKGGQLASYYSDGADDYYAREGDSKQWQGKLCELGLAGDIDQETFKDVLGNIPGQDHPVRASQRNDMESRIGIDLTFQAPKVCQCKRWSVAIRLSFQHMKKLCLRFFQRWKNSHKHV